MSKIKIVGIIGEAGAGKDTLLRALAEEMGDSVHKLISYTTRRPRSNETNGVDYYFVSSQEFTDLILQDKILEATVFNDWVYGTGLDGLDENKINIGVLNPEGTETLAENEDIDLLVVMCVCPAKERLIRQLTREDDPDVDEVVRRYLADKSDFNSFRISALPHIIDLNTDNTTTPEQTAKLLANKIRSWAEKDNELI